MRTVEIIFTNKLCDNASLNSALIYQVIHTLKVGIEDADIVDMSIYSMQTLLNSIGIVDTIAYLDKFFAIAVNALMNYSGVKRIRTYVKRILDFYIRDKAAQSKKEFKNLQFLYLNEI